MWTANFATQGRHFGNVPSVGDAYRVHIWLDNIIGPAVHPLLKIKSVNL